MASPSFGEDSAGNVITYRAFDINSRVPGARRDTERFVVGSNGSVYYTDNHYSSFIKVE